MVNKVVIVGAGHAGGRCALLLRQRGFTGAVTLIGEESSPPYERPPLSKGLLTGDKVFEDCLLVKSEVYRELGIDLHPGEIITTIDIKQQSVLSVSNNRYEYDRLVLATGGECRRLNCEGASLGNIFVLRKIGDSHAIADKLIQGANVVIVGGGFIGLETAASAVKNGCQVTIVENAERLLGRVCPQTIADDITAIHKQNGVQILLGAEVEKFSGNGVVDRVILGSGETLPADLVIVGIGIIPCTELAEKAGLEIENGIKANQFCKTSNQEIYAIGDCARGYNQFYKQWLRLESWQNAEQQADLVASHICGIYSPWETVPWFWSDQYQYNIQIAGFLQDTDDLVKRGAIGEGKVLYLGINDSRVSGAVGIGKGTSAARDLRVSQKLIESQTAVPKEKLENPSIKLKDLLIFGS